MAKRIILALFLLLLLAGCTVTQSFMASTADQGESFTSITVDQFFLDVLEDLSDVVPTQDYSIMDQTVLSFANQVYASGASSDTSLVRTDKDGKGYLLTFHYTSLKKLCSDLMKIGNHTLLQVGDHSISISLSMENYAELKTVIPFLSDPNFEVYGPEYSNGMSEEEYLEMIGFLLDERGPEAVKNSSITVAIETPSSIKEMNNMKQLNDKAASCTFPITDALLLNEPITFSVSW